MWWLSVNKVSRTPDVLTNNLNKVIGDAADRAACFVPAPTDDTIDREAFAAEMARFRAEAEKLRKDS